MNTIIRKIRSEEHDLLREFLYHAIYLPEGVEPPPRSVVDLPELQVYVTDFGTRSGDYCMVAEAEGNVVGAAWCRIMEDYGHIDSCTPSLAISLLPEYRGQGTGTRLLNGLLLLLRENGYRRASLCPEGKPGPAPLPANGIPYRGGERYRIFNALGRNPRGHPGILGRLGIVVLRKRIEKAMLLFVACGNGPLSLQWGRKE